MVYKDRRKSKKLLMYESLAPRMRLPDAEWADYMKLLKGFQGEVKFDGLVDSLQCRAVVLDDLLFEVGGKEYQIDKLMILAKKIHLFEVKNFEGEYRYAPGDQLVKLPNFEVDNPLVQVKRNERGLRHLFREMGVSPLPIVPLVVFVNFEFTLLQAPLDRPFILPTQLYPFLRKLNNETLELSDYHGRLAERLVSVHRLGSRYDKFPDYRYGELEKRFYCGTCRSADVKVDGQKCICGCGAVESVEDGVMRHVREFQLLFPGERITTAVIYEWCGRVRSMKRTGLILEKHFTRVGTRNHSYFE